jgi:hypothetical protein
MDVVDVIFYLYLHTLPFSKPKIQNREGRTRTYGDGKSRPSRSTRPNAIRNLGQIFPGNRYEFRGI